MPTIPCVGPAYEVVGTNVYTLNLGRNLVNLVSGLVNVITGLGAPPINAIGYHTVHNYIYGISYSVTPQAIVRIGLGGGVENVGPNAVIPVTTTTQPILIGDIDTNQQYWLAYAGGANWIQVDMNLASATYGTVVNTGVAGNFRWQVGDWAYIPNQPNRLYALGREVVSTILGVVTGYNTHLVYFDLNTKAWVEVFTFVNTPGGLLNLVGQAAWGAIYSTTDGFLYATEQNSGATWRFPINPVPGDVGTALNLVGTLPLLGAEIDGARCALNPDIFAV